ncbi:MAG: D-arabinono-1,4-lactone oxidase, partial [Nannocystaceae bacterium]
DRAAECVAAVRRVLAVTSASAGCEFQLRFEGPASVSLAPNVGIETMWIDFNLFDREGTRELGKRLAEVVLGFAGRPHWSKHIPDVGFCARTAYGDTIDAWEAVRRRCDPDGLFVNTWYRRYIAPKLASG